jgi:hypothetical protein
MERRYPHRPDTEKLRRQLDRAPQLLGLVETTLGEGRGHLGIVNAGVDDVWEAAAARWLFGQSPAEALELFPRGCVIVRIGLDRFPGPVLSGAAERWLGLPALVGDEQLTRAVADRFLAPGSLEDAPPFQPQEVARARVLAALRTGEDNRAAELLAELRRMGPRDAPPMLVESDAARTDLAAAVLAGDQTEVDAAAAAFSAAWLRFGGRSSNRAYWTYLLNVPALVLMSAAVRRGLTPTPGLPDVPPELILSGG